MTPSEAPDFRLAYTFQPVLAPNAVNLYAFLGEPVKVFGISAPPPNAVFDAAPAAPAGQLAYHDLAKGAWVLGRDIRTVHLAQHKEILLAQLDKTLEKQAASLSRTYTEAERYTWQFQEADAKQYQLDQTLTPLLQQLAAANGYNVQTLCQRILAKAAMYRSAYTQILAEYQAEQNRLKAAFTTDELRKLTLADLLV